MNSRQRFVLIFSGVLMVPFVVFTSLHIDDLGVYASSYAIIYFVLRPVLNPRMRIKVDVLGLALVVVVVFTIVQNVLVML